MNSDRIEKQALLNAPRSDVWQALTDSRRFGSWFGMKLEGPFVAGQYITGTIAPTTVDPEVAEMQRAHSGKKVKFLIDRIEPEILFSIRWHPFAINPEVDYSQEPMTLVTFKLTEQSGEVLLSLTESGFDKIPDARREAARAANDGGWAKQMELIAKYLRQTRF